jgi:heat shock protein HtpX
MRHPAVRLLMFVVGVVVATVYAVVAYLGYELLAALVSTRLDLATVAVAVCLATVLFGTVSYWTGTRQVLAAVGAVQLPRERAPGVYSRRDRLCAAMDIDPPAVYVAGFQRPNALALGGARRGAVVVDRTLFRVLDGDEFEALLAHELAHLESYDSLVQTLAYSLLRSLAGLLLLVVAPLVLLMQGFARGAAWAAGRPRSHRSVFGLARALIERGVATVLLVLTLPLLALSRRREFAADARAAEITDPLALARALRKIERASQPGWGLLSLLYTRGDERDDDAGGLSGLLSTHPDTDERVRRLLERASDRDLPRGSRIEIR